MALALPAHHACTRLTAPGHAGSHTFVSSKPTFGPVSTAAAGSIALSLAGSSRRYGQQRKVSRRASAVPERWKPFPAEMSSPSGQKLVWLMKENPGLVEDALETELDRLSQEQQQAAELEESQKGQTTSDALVLSQRKAEILAKERSQAVAELMYLTVCMRLQALGAPPVKPLKEGGWVSLGAVNLKSLTTDIYSLDALDMVKEHLFQAVLTQGQPGMPVEIDSAAYGAQVAQVGLFVGAQMYAMSVLFGYFLRRVDKRFQLEKMMSSMSIPDLDEEPDGSSKTLKQYIEGFDPERLQQEGLLTGEAQMATSAQVQALFGDLKLLQGQVAEVLGPPDPLATQEDLGRKIEEALKMGKLPSMKIAISDMRRLVLEAVAFGALLKDSESGVEAASFQLTEGKVMEGFAPPEQ